jgi:hypothetical protein
MEMDFLRIHKWLAKKLKQSTSVADGMNGLIDQCEKELSHPDWAKLRHIDHGNLTSLRSWLETPFRVEPPTKPLKGIWFGLFNPCHADGTPTADIYVCGSERFDPDPGSNEWACGPDWWPDSRYANSAVLTEIYRIAYSSDPNDNDAVEKLGIHAEYFLCLGYGAFAVKALLNLVDPSLILGTAPSLGIAVGFDAGDFLLLGQLTPAGLSSLP